MEKKYLLNQWYTAARSDEVGAAPLGRKICNQDIVLFRGEDGKIAALRDRCPHRMAPLSRGEVIRNELRCGYHGASFDRDGNCTSIPSQRDLPVPQSVRVQPYPVHESFGLVFIWFGEPNSADPSQIPSWMKRNTEDGWVAVHGYHHVKGHYQLIIDNILDLTHTTYLHKTTLSGPGVDETPMDVTIDGDTVRTSRVIRNVEPPQLQKVIRGFKGNVDRWQLSEFNPPHFLNVTIGSEPAGTADELAVPLFHVLNSAIPETDTTTHYFWSVARCFKVDDGALSKKFHEMISFAFDEDAAMIEAQQARISGAEAGEALVNFRGDSAGAAARRIVRRKLANEPKQTSSD